MGLVAAPMNQPFWTSAAGSYVKAPVRHVQGQGSTSPGTCCVIACLIPKMGVSGGLDSPEGTASPISHATGQDVSSVERGRRQAPET